MKKKVIVASICLAILLLVASFINFSYFRPLQSDFIAGCFGSERNKDFHILRGQYSKYKQAEKDNNNEKKRTKNSILACVSQGGQLRLFL